MHNPIKSAVEQMLAGRCRAIVDDIVAGSVETVEALNERIVSDIEARDWEAFDPCSTWDVLYALADDLPEQEQPYWLRPDRVPLYGAAQLATAAYFCGIVRVLSTQYGMDCECGPELNADAAYPAGITSELAVTSILRHESLEG